MSYDQALIVSQVSKSYVTYKRPLDRLLQSWYRDKKTLHKEFKALENVDFSVAKGETFGIVGQNGSGKSTLLQIIAGTLAHTSGDVTVNGRVAALLELGAGFNMEFTGIENARLNATIMGVNKKDFERKLPEIIEFSGLEQFINQPVKTYSSGMYVRLAFSVAVNLDPDILIVDEALGVGDARFQRKCFRKLEQLKNDGVTILFVSHALDSVINHCDRAMYLDNGVVRMIGHPKEVVTTYLDALFKADQQKVVGSKETDTNNESAKDSGLKESRGQNNDADQVSHTGEINQSETSNEVLIHNHQVDSCKTRHNYNPQEYRWGDARAKIVDYHFTEEDKLVTQSCQQGANISINTLVYFEDEIPRPIYAITIKTTDGTVVYATNTRMLKQDFVAAKKGSYKKVSFDLKLNLMAGHYFVSLGVAEDDEEKDHIPLDRRYDLIHLHVEDDQTSFGLAMLNGEIKQSIE